MKKQGFTLIELLAVIVILAIIAIISVPIITDLINKSRYGAFGVTKKNIEHAAELYHARNADDLVWEEDISYVTIGTLKSKKFLSNNVVNTLDSTSINDDTKVLLYRKGRKVDYSLQLYDKQFFDWYQGQMVQASKAGDITLPTNVGDKVTVDLDTLMGKGLVDELRLPLELGNRCVGYVEIEKTTDNLEYNAYVDCLQGASTFASHYVSYGGKYLDEFRDVKETSDGGFIAVGRSNSEVITKYGTGNNGGFDAIMVKFKSDGTVEWSRNFGGSKEDYFNSVVEVADGYVAVGTTYSNDGDITDFKGSPSDALIVKYDKAGNVKYKKSLGSSNNNFEVFNKIIEENNKLVIVGYILTSINDGDIPSLNRPATPGSLDAVILIYDQEFNLLDNHIFSGASADTYRSVLYSSDGSYITVGESASTNGDMASSTCPSGFNYAGIIVKYNSSFEVNTMKTFCGVGHTYLYDIIEVSDGYIVVGNSAANDGDMADLSKVSNGYTDAIILKYDKLLQNLMWKKSFGGSDADTFYDIEKISNDEVMVVGYSKSSDFDMNGISRTSDGYSDAIAIKYNTSNGNITQKRVFGGTNSEQYNMVIKTSENNYVVAGTTYSNDLNLKNFNKGHSDAILVSYDKNFNLLKKFQEPVILIDKLKTIVPTYGSSISLKYDNVYTTNDPSKDLKSWCSSFDTYGNNNYPFVECLRPFNNDDKKLLTNIEKVGNVKQVFAGEREYLIDKDPKNNNNWYQLFFRLYNSGYITISNFKLKFADGYTGSIEQSVNDGYIEPLVTIANSLYPSPAHYPNPLDIIKTGGVLENSSYPVFLINIKPKSKKLQSLIFTTNKDITGSQGGMAVYELRNFDMSVTVTE